MSIPVVGYVLDHHLQTSQTFVSGELDELRRQGTVVRVVALRHGDRAVPDPEVLHLSDLRPGRKAAARAHLRLAGRHPGRYAVSAARLARVRSEVGTAPSQVDWRTLPAAVEHLRGVGALHAHFAWSAAAVAYVLAPLLRVPWSFTAHANDIFSRQRNLPLKLARADRVVTVCDYNQRWLREHLAVTRHVDTVVCGVRLPPRSPRRPEVDVVAVGRLVPKKGFDVLVEAAGLLQGVTVEIVGEGPERARLEELARRSGASVHFVGALPHEQALERVAAASVFCLPARVARDGDRDSMPVVLKEAMAREVPVVATAVVAIPEMVDEEVGRLVPPDDPAALAAAIGELLGDPALCARLGAAGRERVRERFTLEAEVAKLRTLLVRP